MTVADVIEKLKQFSPEEYIYLLNREGDYCYFKIYQEKDGDITIQEG